ncbi:hypothetical protein M413DRAFT_395416 [Hebeloma cylindrosporum]|uniref:Uncharacterized protein n=1 Tax=Hebeloma cylindrosporum TaxID=76867 RepID=A0A0C2XZP9_HEBCY|nr:hypothetical protein M413DRAFT_395416 [Hebeloma cylindrosporum h7]
MKLLATVALSILFPSIKASFPGSTFGIVYNTSDLILTSGPLKTFETSPGSESKDYLTTVSDTKPDLGAFLTTSGYLNNACNAFGSAYLAPPQPPVEGLKYLLHWSPSPSGSLPEGSISDGFQLGPAPSYDTVVNVKAGDGSWKLVRLEKSGPLFVGWSDGAHGIPVTLEKTGTDSVTC